MQHLSPHDVMTMFMALATLLGCAKLAAELMQKIGQPPILGEISVGIFLGPTVLGHYRPHLYETLFPTTGPMPIVLDTVTTLGVVFFLLTAGLEIDLRSIFRQGKSALLVSSFGVAFPFAAGFLAASAFPNEMGAEAGANALIFSLFVGTALSISALPVIAKILMDLNLLRTEMGTVIISSAMFDDLVGWILFSFVLGMMHPPPGGSIADGVKHTVVLVVLFVGLTLTVGRWLIDKIVPVLQAHTTWPGGVIGFIFTLTMAGAAFTEYAGIHAVFGAFVVGIAVGESGHLRKRTSQHIHQIVNNVFAPFFFASIGLRTNFVSNFHLGLTATVIASSLRGQAAGSRLGRAPGWDGPDIVTGSGARDECARSHGNHSGDPGAAGRIDPGKHVCGDGDHGLVHFAGFGAGHSLPDQPAADADPEGHGHRQTILARPGGEDPAGSAAGDVRGGGGGGEQCSREIPAPGIGTGEGGPERLGR